MYNINLCPKSSGWISFPSPEPPLVILQIGAYFELESGEAFVEEPFAELPDFLITIAKPAHLGSVGWESLGQDLGLPVSALVSLRVQQLQSIRLGQAIVQVSGKE